MRTLLLLACLAGCATEPSRCAEAADALASCHGIDGDAFLEACNAAPADEAAALVDEVLAQSCPAVDGKADGIGEWAFVEACRPVMMSAFVVDQARNPNSSPLPERFKTSLRPYFGGLVDTIKVHWAATLPDDWPMLHVENAFMDVGAQTFGSHIFVAHSSTTAPASLLAHELVHAKQAQRFGGVAGFYREYCRGFYRAGLSYEKNPLEIEAYSEGARVTRCMTSGC